MLSPETRRRLRRWIRRMFSLALLAAFLIAVYATIQLYMLAREHLALVANLRTLAVEVNTVGVDAFRNDLCGMASRNGATLTPDDIKIAYDEDEYRFTVPFRWRLDLVVTELHGERVMQWRTRRWISGT